jgi:hypothetical protein
MKIYFGGDSFLYGYGLNRKDSLPYLFSKYVNSDFLDDSQSESSNKLIYLRTINNLMSDESCDFYFIMWSRGIDRRFEKILDSDFSERWVNIIPHLDHQKKDKIRNDIQKFVMERLVTDDSSFLNTLTYIVMLQELLKSCNKNYIFSFANDHFFDSYSKYKNEFNVVVNTKFENRIKETNFISLINKLDFDYIVMESVSTFLNLDELNRHPNEEECIIFVKHLFEKYFDLIGLHGPLPKE